MPVELIPYEDDSTILDDAELWRRIPSKLIVSDSNRGGKRPSSAAFTNHQNGTPMSVVLGREVLEAGRDTCSVIAAPGLENFCLASVTAGLARSLKQGIIRSPCDDEPAHAEVFGEKPQSIRRKFARAATWIIGPDTESD